MSARLFRLVLAALAVLTLAGCAAGPIGEWASDEAVEQARYSADGPPQVTLVTVVNKRTGAGDHSSLIISGGDRVLYDPAGTWHNPSAPQRRDVHHGFVPQLEEYYLDYHARETHDVIAQTLRLSPDVAEDLLRAAREQPRAGPGFCAVRTSQILRRVPGFEGLPRSFFPRTLQEAFGEMPGVETRIVEDSDVHGQITVRAGESI